MKLLFMQLSAIGYDFLLFRSKYFSRTPSQRIPVMWEAKFHTHIEQQAEV